MSFGRILLGLLTGGMSELARKAVKGVAGTSVPVGQALNGNSGSYGDFYSDDFVKEIEKLMQSETSDPSSPSFLSRRDDVNIYNQSDGNGLSDLIRGWTGSGLTTAQIQANLFNRGERIAGENFTHNEAVDARLWEQYVAQNKYSWETQSMQNAGLNPAMMYQGSLVPTNATGAMGTSQPASSVNPGSPGLGLGDLMTGLMSLVRMPLEMKKLNTDIKSQVLDNQLKEKDIASYDDRIGSKIANLNADTETKIAKLDEIASKIRNNDADTMLKQANISKVQAEEAVEWARYAQIGLSNELQQQLNPLLVECQELENELKRVESQYRERQILADLAEKRARVSALYAQAALDGAQKTGVDIQNKISGAEAKFAANNAQNRANYLRWTAYTQRESLKQAKYQTDNAQYYSEHYEEAFKNSWSQSGTEFGVTKMIGEAIGTAATLGMMLAL